MTPEEKIEALREWAASTYYDESSPTWFAGYACARDEVRDIIDPPTPQWRKRVDALLVDALHPKGVSGSNLGAALYHLSHVANPDHYDIAEELANVVVVAEVAVGDGWRADPDDLRRFQGSETTALFIAEALTTFYEPTNWQVAGNRAAAALRKLLEGDKQ